MAALIPPNTLHALEGLEDAEVVSRKGVIGGVGYRTLGRDNFFGKRHENQTECERSTIENVAHGSSDRRDQCGER